MRRPFLSRFLARRRKGAALVIILAFVVLLAVLVLAFFSRALLARQISNASANQTKVDLLARGAIDVIVSDLRQEIEVGSTSKTTNQFKSYYPLQPTNMLPARSGNPSFTAATNDPIPNLVRRSVRNDPLAPNLVGVAASAVNSTTDPSANGRTISAARWNAHYLIPRQSAGSATIDSRPITNFVSPDWVMVTKDGPKTLTAPDSSVIGRYAYAIYDEGGLLDANVAGFPGGLTNYPSAATNVVAMKGSAALADLSQIGITNADNLVGWRNYATARPSGSLGSYAFDATSYQQYWAHLTNATNSGFLSAPTNAFNSRSDQIFTSRQALLKFQRAAGLPQDALQYLGTFSRALEQASIRPDPNRPKNTGARLKSDAGLTTTAQLTGWGGNDTYDSTGALQDQINPSFLATVRSDGRPVAKRRFPLSRLVLFEQPVIDTAADMKRYFGLVWDNTADRWNYVSPDGTMTASRIKTLAEVAAAGREPDFFEVLKAAITCDSLGKQHGGNEGQGAPARFTSKDTAIDGYTDLQIFQIGANIIDQADANGYPTAIRTADGPVGSSGKAEPPARTISGVEDLPYLYGWMSAWYRTRQLGAADILSSHQPPSSKFPYETATLLQPIIWNPHSENGGTPATSKPTQFRVIAGGVGMGAVPLAVNPMVCSTVSSGSAAAWWSGFDPDPTPNAPAFPVNNITAQPQPYVQAVVSPATSWITFQTAASGKANFREPQRLQSPNYPPGSNSAAAAEGVISTIGNTELNDPADTDTLSAQALGIYTGRCWTGPTTAGDLAHSYLNMGAISRGLRLELQYEDTSGNFVTYDTIDYAYCTSSLSSSGNLSIVDNDDTASLNRGMRTGVRADPRTNRWGLPTMRVSPHWDSRVTFPTAPNVFPADPVFSSALPMFKWPQGKTLGADGVAVTGAFLRAIGDNQGGTPKASGWKPMAGSLGPQPFSDLEANLRTVPGGGASDTTVAPGGKMYYTDPDGVLRRAAGAFYRTASNDGLPLVTNNNESRPVILNRPFRSVAELGYAFRGVAWKDIDFFTPESGDAALLDAFCLNEIDGDEGVVAGRVNLNTRQPRVLAALISGVSKAEGGILNPTESLGAANALVTWTADTATQIGGVAARGPLRNRSELVGKFVSTNGAIIPTGGSGPNRADVPNVDGSLAFSGYSTALTNGVFATTSDVSIKRRHESVIRALADAGDTRTWNLLVDLVAQTGRYGNSGVTDLSKFIVEGETRYWLHIAIDRFTGEVVGKQIEVVGD